MDFNKYTDSYRRMIEESISFTGKEHDFFTKVKADILCKIIKLNLAHVDLPYILDVGCGHGFIHNHLKSTKIKLVGVEMADEVIKIAKENNTHVNYINHDGMTLPFEENIFDVVFAICVLHHVPCNQWPSFLSEMKRVLKKGGIAIIFEHNPYNPLTRYIVANNVLDSDAVLLSSHKLKKLMKKAGFANRASRNFLFTPFSYVIFRWLDDLLGKFPFGAQYYAFGKKL